MGEASLKGVMISFRKLRDGLRYRLGGGYVQDVAYRGDSRHYAAVNELRLQFQQMAYPPEQATSVASAFLVFRHKEDLVMLRMRSPGSTKLQPIFKISSWKRLFEIGLGCVLFCCMPFVAAVSITMDRRRRRRLWHDE